MESDKSYNDRKENLENLVKTNSKNEYGLPLEDYTAQFSKRYKEEDAFREIVHNYLGLSGFKKVSLSLGKKILPSWYNKKTEVLIQEYAKKIMEDLIKVVDVEKDLLELKKAAEDLESKAANVNDARSLENSTQQQYYEAVTNKDSAVRNIENEIKGKISGEEERSSKEAEEAKKLTDAESLARQKLEDMITSSPLVKVGESGSLSFDEQKICERLENIFLSEIIEGIEREDGNSGFIARVKASYTGLISHYDVMEDLSELPDVDWVESTILSRTKGFKKPTFPYLITAKYKSKSKGKVSIDTAIALDSSSSMNENNRFVVAKKTALATVALMRKLNYKNQTYLAHFNGKVYPVTSAELLRSVRPINGTETDLALNWLLNTLVDSELSIAYLITDGYPNSLNDAVAAAKKFRNYHNVLLRVFLIDGDEKSEENIKIIGSAAGPATKVITVKNYQLSGNVIRDVSKAIGEMYSIT